MINPFGHLRHSLASGRDLRADMPDFLDVGLFKPNRRLRQDGGVPHLPSLAETRDQPG